MGTWERQTAAFSSQWSSGVFDLQKNFLSFLVWGPRRCLVYGAPAVTEDYLHTRIQAQCNNVHKHLVCLNDSDSQPSYRPETFNVVTNTQGESNGKLPPRTCPGCSVPEPYRSHDWLLPARPLRLNTNGWMKCTNKKNELSLCIWNRAQWRCLYCTNLQAFIPVLLCVIYAHNFITVQGSNSVQSTYNLQMCSLL